MKGKFLFLLVLTLITLLGLWFLAVTNKSSQETVANSLFVPEISTRINDVNRVEIISAGNNFVATLVKKGDHWQNEQVGGYWANWQSLQSLLASLAQARVIEPKTDKAEYYARLGVEDIAADDAGGVLLELSIDDETTSILVGDKARGRQGQYVRLQQSVTSALLDRELSVSKSKMDWVDTGIMDISASEVAEVEVIHPQGERVLLTRVSADQTDFELVGLPKDREIKSSWAVNSMASVLSMLNLESVRPAGEIDWKDSVKLRLLTFSGMEIAADVRELGDKYMLRLHAGFPAGDVTASEPEEGTPTDEGQLTDKNAKEKVIQDVTEVNHKLDGWAFEISKQKYEAMVKKFPDLLKPLDSE